MPSYSLLTTFHKDSLCVFPVPKGSVHCRFTATEGVRASNAERTGLPHSYLSSPLISIVSTCWRDAAGPAHHTHKRHTLRLTHMHEHSNIHLKSETQTQGYSKGYLSKFLSHDCTTVNRQHTHTHTASLFL